MGAKDEATVDFDTVTLFPHETQLTSLALKIRVLLAEPLNELLDGPYEYLGLRVAIVLPTQVDLVRELIVAVFRQLGVSHNKLQMRPCTIYYGNLFLNNL